MKFSEEGKLLARDADFFMEGGSEYLEKLRNRMPAEAETLVSTVVRYVVPNLMHNSQGKVLAAEFSERK